MLSANKKTSGFSGLSSRTKKLIEKADRQPVRIPHVRQHSSELKKELFSPPLESPPRLERRDSFHSLPAEIPCVPREIELKNLGATNREKPIVAKGVPIKFKIPNCQIDLRPPQSESTPDLSRAFISAPSSPQHHQNARGVFGLVPTTGHHSVNGGHPVIRGQNKIEMKIGQVQKPFMPSAPLKNYSLNAPNP